MNLNWTRSTEWLPATGKYLVYYSVTGEHHICDFDGRVFSYEYCKIGTGPMICDLHINSRLWWQYLGRPE